MSVNRVYFSEEDVADGHLTEFVAMLNKLSYTKSGLYNDIHIFPADIGAFVVEWAQVPWDKSYGGAFKYVRENQYVFTEYHMPDGSYQCFETEDAYKEALADMETKEE